jgi:hypothetical protein
MRENLRRRSPRTLATKGLAVVSRQRTASHFLFHQGIFDQNQHGCHPRPSYLSLFLRLKLKLKGRHFDTTEVTEAESQAVLNTLTEHDFQDVFKKWQEHWEECIRAEGGYFEGEGGQ